MAMGSCNEMQVLLELSKDLGFIEETVQIRYCHEYDEIGKMLNVLRRRWEQF